MRRGDIAALVIRYRCEVVAVLFQRRIDLARMRAYQRARPVGYTRLHDRHCFVPMRPTRLAGP
jgi:hypothetical protein